MYNGKSRKKNNNNKIGSFGNSMVSRDLVQEIISSVNEEEKKEAAQGLISNLEKINHHANRAANIINQLQEHARSGTANNVSKKTIYKSCKEISKIKCTFIFVNLHFHFHKSHFISVS